MVVISIRACVTWANKKCVWAYCIHPHTHALTHAHAHPHTEGITWGTSKGIWDVLPSAREIIFAIPHPAFTPCCLEQNKNWEHTHTHMQWLQILIIVLLKFIICQKKNVQMRLFSPLISFFWILMEMLLFITMAPQSWVSSPRLYWSLHVHYSYWTHELLLHWVIYCHISIFHDHYGYLCASILAESQINVSGSTHMQASTDRHICTHRMESVSGVTRQQWIIHRMI